MHARVQIPQGTVLMTSPGNCWKILSGCYWDNDFVDSVNLVNLLCYAREGSNFKSLRVHDVVDGVTLNYSRHFYLITRT
eukprot:Pgem_evm1s1486